jgi:hypothetical protein
MNLYGNTTTEFVRRGQSGESPLHSSMANQFRCDGADPPFSPVAPSSRSMTPSSTGCPPSAHLLPAISLQDVERAHIIRVLAETYGIIEGPRGGRRGFWACSPRRGGSACRSSGSHMHGASARP